MRQISTKIIKTLALTSVGTLFATELIAADNTATNNGTEVEVLKEQIQELEQRVNVLERQQQVEGGAVAAPPRASAQLTVGADGVNFKSADSNFVAGVHAWVQMDSRTFFQNGSTPGIDGFLLRRARIIFQGTIFHDFDFNLTPEFAGNAPQILDAYLNYRYSPELQLEFGKFKPPVGLEALEPDIDTFLNERSLATDLVPYRGIGAELHGDISDGTLSYAAGIFNGLPDYNTSTINTNLDNDMAFAGRLFASPFKQSSISPLEGLGFGVSGSYEHDRGTSTGLTPGYTTDGQEKFFTYASGVVANGTHWRILPQGYYYYGPFGLIGEYVVSDQRVTKTAAPVTSGNLHNTAWEISGGWVLTGENDSYNGVVPRHPFNLRDGDWGWGAWQIVARYADLDIDSATFPNYATAATSASGARAWAAGVNWYLNRDLRANVSFSRTTFTGGSTGTVSTRPENVLFTRVQLAF